MIIYIIGALIAFVVILIRKYIKLKETGELNLQDIFLLIIGSTFSWLSIYAMGLYIIVGCILWIVDKAEDIIIFKK